MSELSIILGVPLMDQDHAVLEALFERVAQTEDAQLLPLLDDIDAEMSAHFGREEELMRAEALTVLPCHVLQHEMLKGQIRKAPRTIPSSDAAALRQFLTDVLPELMRRHMNLADRVAADMLRVRHRAEA